MESSRDKSSDVSLVGLSSLLEPKAMRKSSGEINNISDESMKKYLGPWLFFQNSSSSELWKSNHSFLLNSISVRMCCSHPPATFYRPEVSYDFNFKVSHSFDQFHCLTSCMKLLSLLVLQYGTQSAKEKNEWDKLNNKTQRSCWNQTPDSLFVCTTSLCLSVWRAPCPPSQCPFPWPRHWHWIVIRHLSEEITFSNHWLRDQLRPDQSSIISPSTTASIR